MHIVSDLRLSLRDSVFGTSSFFYQRIEGRNFGSWYMVFDFDFEFLMI